MFPNCYHFSIGGEMSKKSDELFMAFWRENEKEMRARGIKPVYRPFPTKAEQIAEMVGAMLLCEDIVVFMYPHYLQLTMPPHKDYGKMIEAAKQAGKFPKVKLPKAS
jgi:hypothetical protein